jgi:ribonucleoside-diphosphate reductase alpha subunit
MQIDFVTNRRGELEPLDVSKIIHRLKNLSTDPLYGKPLMNVCVNSVALDTMRTIYDKIHTAELDDQSCRVALGRYYNHEDYEKLAARIAISNLIKEVDTNIENYVKNLEGVLSAEYSQCLLENKDFFENLQNISNNFRYTFRGFFVMKQNHYLLRKLGTAIVAETPDLATIRVSVAMAVGKKIDLTEADKKNIKMYYDAFSDMQITMATPVLLNSGTINSQYASCFVLNPADDLKSIMKHKKISALCQKYSGGIGESWSSIRSQGSVIKGTNGISGGLLPLAKMTDKLGYYIDQGGGKRPGSISPQIIVTHPDLLETLKLIMVKDTEKAREAHKLFYAVWITNNFLEAVSNNEMWYFIDPSVAPEFQELHGAEFNKAYESKKHLAKMSMPAREVMEEILKVQANTGMPYIINKDNINEMRNQPVPVYSSNLCAEICIPANKKEVGVCNLGSISIKKMLSKSADGEYFNPITKQKYTLREDLIEKNTRILVRAINGAIDTGFYPTKECLYSNKLRRPVAIGVMGVADAVSKMGMVFGSEEACQFRARFEELITYYAYHESMLMAKEFGPITDHHLYKSGQGLLHPILFAQKWPVRFPFRKNWSALAEEIKINGLRNSVLRANMPTGNTGIKMGNSLCFEPMENAVYKFSAYSMDLVVINKYLRRDLRHLGILNERFMSRLVSVGSIKDINFKFFTAKKTEVPEENLVKEIYKSAFEISPYRVMNMCIAAQPFIDQSQSMNLWSEQISINTANLYIYGAKHGLKTLCYYIKSASATKKNVCEGCVL